jgi:hypothetical protein
MAPELLLLALGFTLWMVGMFAAREQEDLAAWTPQHGTLKPTVASSTIWTKMSDILENTSRLATLVGSNTMPPRDPNDDQDEEDNEPKREDEDEEPPVVREPDE